ncbi:MAG: macro domain-containing protein [Leadbetterella sp.]|nr:macro domain-containing protein [Leadbetterella sp.]
MAKITEIKGNVFESDCQVLVNPVNCVGVMGKGAALEFKKRFPTMYSAYVVMCEKKILKPGMLQLVKDEKKWILNFPTKNHWRFPSKIEYIEIGLKKFVEFYKTKNIRSIAFPKIGASAGGLEWLLVRSLIYKYLEPLDDLDVEIYHYDPNAIDGLFNVLFQKIHLFEISDYKENLGIRSDQAILIYDAMRNDKIKTMMDIQKIRGIGRKTIEKLYDFALDSNKKAITSPADKQINLF